jgi:predicted metalloprotease with PDZ domain
MHVYSKGAAEQAGLAGGDVIIAINGLKTTAQNLERMVSRKAPGTPLRVHAFRRDELMEFTLVTQPASDDTCYLALQPKPGKRSKLLLDAWLSQP